MASSEELSTRVDLDKELCEEEELLQPVWIAQDESCMEEPFEAFPSLEELDLEETMLVEGKECYNSAEVYEKLRYAGLKLPKVILSIITDKKTIHIDADVKHSLEEGLAKIIDVTDVWLLIGPKENAVSDAAKKTFFKIRNRTKLNRSACIGILDSLEEENRNSSFPGNMMHFDKVSAEDEKEHYSHILKLVADFKFHPSLEELLATPKGGKATPVVDILVHGGIKAFFKLEEDLQGFPKIPVVIFKGSGGLADILADALAAHTKMKKKGELLKDHIEKFVDQLPDSEESDDYLANIIGIRDMIEMFSDSMIVYDHIRDPYGLYRAVLKSCKVLSGETHSIVKAMKVAISAGDIDEFKNDILRCDEERLTSLFYFAVRWEKADFIKFLLSKSEYSDRKKLESFVESHFQSLCFKKSKDCTVFKKLMDKAKAKRTTGDSQNQEANGKEVLLNNMENKNVEDSEFDVTLFDDVMNDLLEGDFDKESKTKQNATQKLMFLSLFTVMSKLVDCFWEHESEKAVENAVIIYRMAKSLASKSELSENARKCFEGITEDYEKRAVEVLTQYYHTDYTMAIYTVQLSLPLWGDNSILTIAANGGSRDIVSHPACQGYLSNVWNGKPNKRMDEEDGQSKDDQQTTDKNSTGSEDVYTETETGCLSKMLQFLFFVPKGKLFLYELFFIIFLGCFSFIVLVKRGQYHEPLRFTVFTIVTALALDEIREVLETGKNDLWLKLKEWYKSIWNRLDFVAILLFYIAFAFGFYNHSTAERSMMAVDLVLWVVKFAQFYRMFYTLGPYLIMIYKMMFHMAGFLLVLVIAVIAYGVFMHTLLFPNVTVSWEILFKILFRPYLLAFGELGVNSYALSGNTTIYGTPKVGEATEIIVVIGMCVYLLLANVLLINMLIAVFNNIYEDIKENSDKIWRFDKYDLIMEFKRKPSAPIPFSIFPNIKRIFQALYQIIQDCKKGQCQPMKCCRPRPPCIGYCKRRQKGGCNPLCVRMSSDNVEPLYKEKDLLDFQGKCMWDYLRESQYTASPDENLSAVLKKADLISKDMMEFNERIDYCFEILRNFSDGNRNSSGV